MLFRKEILAGIKSGTVTLAFRRWKQARIKKDSVIKTAIGLVQIGNINAIDSTNITAAEASLAGFKTLDALNSTLKSSPDGPIYRIEVCYLAPDPRLTIREKQLLSEEEFTLLNHKLRRLDQYSKQGDWTFATLSVIRDHPKKVAIELAGILGKEKEWLKLHIRKLKNLGLTISHNTGYEISPFGKIFLDRLSDQEP